MNLGIKGCKDLSDDGLYEKACAYYRYASIKVCERIR